MRKATFASLLMICGSTAAIAQVSTRHRQTPMQNHSGNSMSNDMAMPMNGTMPDNMMANSPMANDTMDAPGNAMDSPAPNAM